MKENFCKNCEAPWDGASPTCSDCRAAARGVLIQCVQCKVLVALRTMVLVTVRHQMPESRSWASVSVRYCSVCFGKLDAKLQEKRREQERVAKDALKARRDKVRDQLTKAKQKEKERERERRKQDAIFASGRTPLKDD